LLGISIGEDGVAVREHWLVTRDDPKLRGFTHRFLGAELIRHGKTQVGLALQKSNLYMDLRLS
jgi:hypothetical protein